MSAAKKPARKPVAKPDPGKLSFEEAVAELNAIVERIEDGEIGLEQSLAERRRGEALIARCRAILEQAEQDLESVQPDDSEEAEAPRDVSPFADPDEDAG